MATAIKLLDFQILSVRFFQYSYFGNQICYFHRKVKLNKYERTLSIVHWSFVMNLIFINSCSFFNLFLIILKEICNLDWNFLFTSWKFMCYIHRWCCDWLNYSQTKSIRQISEFYLLKISFTLNLEQKLPFLDQNQTKQILLIDFFNSFTPENLNSSFNRIKCVSSICTLVKKKFCSVFSGKSHLISSKWSNERVNQVINQWINTMFLEMHTCCLKNNFKQRHSEAESG